MQFRPEYRDRKIYKYIRSEFNTCIDNGDIVYGRALELSSNGDMIVTIGISGDNSVNVRINANEVCDDELGKCSPVSLIGRIVAMVIIGNCSDGLLLASRKEAQRKCYNEHISKMVAGDILDVAIIGKTKFGLFCDVGCGVCALLPVSRISTARITDLDVNYKWLRELKVAIYENDIVNKKITLTHKELLGTWDDAVRQLEAGIVIGKINTINNNGIFVTLGQNLSGIAYRYDKEEIHVGDSVVVAIKGIYRKNTRVQLRIIRISESKYDVPNFEYLTDISSGHINEWIYNIGDENTDKIVKTVFSK